MRKTICKIAIWGIAALWMSGIALAVMPPGWTPPPTNGKNLKYLMVNGTVPGGFSWSDPMGSFILDASNYSSLNAAEAAASGLTNATVLVTQPTSLSASLTVPANVGVYVLNGGMIKSAGYTLTINGPFSAGLYQVFTGFNPGDVVFKEGSVKDVDPIWFGADPTGTNDSATAINCALESLHGKSGVYYGGTVFVPIGDYKLDSSVLGVDNVNLTGAGMQYHSYTGTRFLPAPGIVAFDLTSGGGNANYRNFAVDGVTISNGTIGFKIGSTSNASWAGGQSYFDNIGVFDLDKGFDLLSTQQIRFSRIQALSNNYGFYTDIPAGGYSLDFSITKSYLNGNLKYAIYSNSATFGDLLIQDDTINVNTLGDIFLKATSPVTISNNHFETGPSITGTNAIDLETGSGNGAISGNDFRSSNYTNAIFVNGTNAGFLNIYGNRSSATYFINATSSTTNIDVWNAAPYTTFLNGTTEAKHD